MPSCIAQDYAAMNAVYDKWLDGPAPTRACVQATLAYPHQLVEVRVIAAKSSAADVEFLDDGQDKGL